MANEYPARWLSATLAGKGVLMTYKLMIEQKPVFLHATVTGRNSKKNVASYLEEILHECLVRKCFRVLIEERLEGPRLGTRHYSAS